MEKQKDPYIGERDSITKLRQGKGTYNYPGGIYQYTGEWKDNKKTGKW